MGTAPARTPSPPTEALPPAPGLPSSPSPQAPQASPSREPGESTDQYLDLFSPPPDLRPDPPRLLSDLEELSQRRLAFPIPGYDLSRLVDNFAEMRGHRVHEAIDILAPRGTPVVAVDDGPVRKLFVSQAGGNTVYQYDLSGKYCYYYAHLDRYEPGLAEGRMLRKGERVGYVGTSGNSPPDTPHLHFTIFKLGPDQRWWEGAPVNPFPLWARGRAGSAPGAR